GLELDREGLARAREGVALDEVAPARRDVRDVEVALRERDVPEEARVRADPAAEDEAPRARLLDLQDDVLAPGLAPRLEVDAHVLEVAETAEIVERLFDLRSIEIFARVEDELAPHDLLARLVVALDLDAVDPDLEPLVHLVGQVEELLFLVVFDVDVDLGVDVGLVGVHPLDLVD